MAQSSRKKMSAVTNLALERFMGRWYILGCFPSSFQPSEGRGTRATYTLLPDGATVGVLNETWIGGKRSSFEGTAFKAQGAGDEAGRLKVRFYVPPFLPLIPFTSDYWVLHVDDDYTYALVGEPSLKYLWVIYSFFLSFTLFFFSILFFCYVYSATELGSSYVDPDRPGPVGNPVTGSVRDLINPVLPTGPTSVYIWKIASRQTQMDEAIYNRMVEKGKEYGYDVQKLKKTTQIEPPPEGDEGPKNTKGIGWLKSLLGK